MAVDTQPNETIDRQEPSTTRLVAGIVEDAQELFKQQVALLQAEVEEDLRQTTQAGIALVTGMAVTLVGAILLALCVAEMLKAVMPAWGAYGLVGLVVTGVGGVLVAGAMAAFSKINPLPEKSAEALKENLGWQTKPN